MKVLFARNYIGSQDQTINHVSVQLVLVNGTFAEIIRDYSTRQIIKHTELATFSSFRLSLCRFIPYTPLH